MHALIADNLTQFNNVMVQCFMRPKKITNAKVNDARRNIWEVIIWQTNGRDRISDVFKSKHTFIQNINSINFHDNI